jgi:phosphate transport system substrate-binding protein
MKRIAMLTITLMIVTALTLAGCSTPAPNAGATEKTNGGADKPLSGKLEISGSTSVQELAEQLAEAFEEANTGVTVTVQGGGSSVGVQNVTDGLSDIGNASRALKDSEKEKGLVEHIIARDGVAAIVHPSNGVSDLTAAQITAIFKGEITNWKDVGGSDAEIIVIIRESSSGTREAFTTLFKLSEKNAEGKEVHLYTEKALECNDNGSMMTNVAGKETAIGFCSVGSLNDTVKGLKIEGVDPTIPNIKDGSYIYWRPFVMATKGEPQGLAKAFLDFVYGEDGAALIGKKFIPTAAQ